MSPLFAEPLSNRGNILQKLHRFEEALASYEAALALRSTYVDAWCGRGVALKELGRFAEALASFEAALAIDPLSRPHAQ